MSQPKRSRAQSEAEKSERRMRILAAALDLFEARNGGLAPMAEVAARAGVAKGTVYLYFRTQEEIYLALLEEHFHAWIDRIELRLGDRPADPAAIAAEIAESGLADLSLLRLATLGPGTLERGVEPTLALRFRRGIERHLEIAGAGLTKTLGGPASLLRDSLALVLGLWQSLEPPPAVGALYSPAEADAHRDRLRAAVEAALVALWRGATG